MGSIHGSLFITFLSTLITLISSLTLSAGAPGADRGIQGQADRRSVVRRGDDQRQGLAGPSAAEAARRRRGAAREGLEGRRGEGRKGVGVGVGVGVKVWGGGPGGV